MYMHRLCVSVHVYVCGACVHTCVCGRDAFTHVCGKKSGLAGGRTDEGTRAGGREDVDIFLRATRECRERHAFDWPGVVGAVAGVQGGRMRGEGEQPGERAEEVVEGGAGGPPFAVDFSGLFFTGDGPRLPG